MNPKQSMRSIIITMSVFTIELFTLFTSKITKARRWLRIFKLPFLSKYALASTNTFLILLFHFLQNQFWNELLHHWKGVMFKLGQSSLAKLSGNKFRPEAVTMFMIEPKSKSTKKIINNYFCVWTCLNSHGKLLFIFKFEQVIIKGSIDHLIHFWNNCWFVEYIYSTINLKHKSN